MPRVFLAALAGTVVFFGVSAGAQTYRWVGEDGRVHYTDTPPPAAAKSVQRKAGAPNVIQTGQVPYALQQAAANFPVTIYTTDNCGDTCKDARALLTQRGVPYREVAVADEKSRAELKGVSGGDMVPVMTVGRSATRGFEPDMWHSALDAAGYPRSSGLTTPAQKPAAPTAKAEAPRQAAEEPSSEARGSYAPLAPDPGASAPQRGPYAP